MRENNYLLLFVLLKNCAFYVLLHPFMIIIRISKRIVIISVAATVSCQGWNSFGYLSAKCKSFFVQCLQKIFLLYNYFVRK